MAKKQEQPVEFISGNPLEGRLCKVFGAALTRETLHEALAELATHGQVMLTVTQPVDMVGNNLSPRGIAQIGVVKDYFAPKPEGKDNAR